MPRPPHRPEQEVPRIQRVADVLRRHFPHASVETLNLGSRSIVSDVDSAHLIFHGGAEDLDALGKFTKALTNAQNEAFKMSEWIGEGMETALTAIYDGRSPATLHEIVAALEHMKIAAAKVEVMYGSWRPSHGANTPAILAVHNARRAWKALANKEAPRKRLNIDTRFGVFLIDLLEALRIGADAPAAFAAWQRIVSDDNAPIYLEG